MPFFRLRGFALPGCMGILLLLLTALLVAALPQCFHARQEQKTLERMLRIRTALTSFYANTGTYPPRYGYVLGSVAPISNDSEATGEEFSLVHYLDLLDLPADRFQDPFAGDGGDTNGDGRIGLLEFVPPRNNPPNERYDGANLAAEAQRQLEEGPRSIVYLPVNLAQFDMAKKYWIEKGFFYAEHWDPEDPQLKALLFPPLQYDAYVLIGMGPGQSTFGLLPDPLGVEPHRDIYHITALRAYFLATRDLNQNNRPDFDYFARTRDGEDTLEFERNGRPANNRLPDREKPDGPGPIIRASP